MFYLYQKDFSVKSDGNFYEYGVQNEEAVNKDFPEAESKSVSEGLVKKIKKLTLDDLLIIGIALLLLLDGEKDGDNLLPLLALTLLF
ncbi:MAG: hypothetical protein KBS44_05580 [Clostridiales bacterium]|nr:hypothetical protein [Candidatus Coliplasma equi]